MTSPPPRRTLRERLLTGPAWTLGDQALSSASNFLTFVLLARAMSPSQLGIYALAFTAMYVCGNIQRSMFVEPHYVHGPHEPHYRPYTTATALSMLMFAGSIAIAAVVAGLVADAAGQSTAPDVLFTFALAAIPYLVQDFMRGIFFTEARFQSAFANDLVAYGGQFALMAALVTVADATPIRALLVVAVSSSLAVLLGAWQHRATLTWPVQLRMTMRRNWKIGRWLAAGSTVSAAANELYVFLSSGILGTAATGAYRGVITILNVNNVFITALIGRTLPRASERLRDAGGSGLNAFLIRLATRDSLPIYILSLLIIIFAEPLLGNMYGDEYRPYATAMQLLAVVAIFTVPTEVLKIGLKARGSGAPMLVISTLSACLTIAMGIPMMREYGIDGIAYTKCLDIVMVNIIVWRFYSRARRLAIEPARPAPEHPADQ